MKERSRYRVLGIDLDGTLVDTAEEIAEAANLAIEDFGLPRAPVQAITMLIGAGTRELMLALLRLLETSGVADAGSIDSDAVLARFAERYAETAGTSCRAYPGVADSLGRLRAGGVRLACVTNKEAVYARRVLAACGLVADLELLVAGDTLAAKKPDASVLLHVMARLGGTPATTAHLGDSRTDVEAARNAGVAAWAVPYGYNGGVPVEHARPDRLFPGLVDVADFMVGK